jgi:predicted MFS family arabinose efflux permease
MAENAVENSNKKFYYGYWVIASMFVLMFPASLIMSVASIFYTPVTKEFGVSLATYGLNLTIIQLACAVGVPTLFSGMCRKLKMHNVLIISLIVEALCFAARALATNIWMFFITSVIIALPMGIFFNLTIQILMNAWFPMNAGTGIGIIASAQGIGGMVLSSIGGLIIQNYGWRICFWVWAALCIIMIPCAFIVKGGPAEKGLKPFVPNKQKNAEEVKTATNVRAGVPVNKVMRTPTFFLLALAVLLFTFVGQYNQYINAYLRQDVGVTAAIAGIISGLIQVGVFFYKITVGVVSDKSMRAGCLYFMLSGILGFVLFLVGGPNVVFIILASFLYGGSKSAVNGYGPLITRALFGQRDFVKIWSRVVSFFTVAGAVGAWVFGVIVDAFGFRFGFLISLLISVLILMLFMIVISQIKKTKQMWIVEEESAPAAAV